MITINDNTQKSWQWDSLLFFVAGSFMLINVAALWVMNFSDIQISLLWAAIPGIVAQAASIAALFKLYPRISSGAPRLARSGAGFALIAGASVMSILKRRVKSL